MTFDEWLDEPQTVTTRRDRASRFIVTLTRDARMELYFWDWLSDAFEAGVLTDAKVDKEGGADAKNSNL